MEEGQPGILFDPTKSQQIVSEATDRWTDPGVVYLVYHGISVNNYDGARLVDFPPVSQNAKVWVAKTMWWQVNQLGGNIVKWDTRYEVAPLTFRFPGLPQYAVVLVQPHGKRYSIPWREPSNDAIVELRPSDPVYVFVNSEDMPEAYARQAGHFDLYIARTYP